VRPSRLRRLRAADFVPGPGCHLEPKRSFRFLWPMDLSRFAFAYAAVRPAGRMEGASYSWRICPVTEEQRPWHRLFGLSWIDFFRGMPVQVELEKDLSLKQQLLAIVLIHKEAATLPCRLPDGFEELAAHNLISFKSHQEALDGWTSVRGISPACGLRGERASGRIMYGHRQTGRCRLVPGGNTDA